IRIGDPEDRNRAQSQALFLWTADFLFHWLCYASLSRVYTRTLSRSSFYAPRNPRPPKNFHARLSEFRRAPLETSSAFCLTAHLAAGHTSRAPIGARPRGPGPRVHR